MSDGISMQNRRHAWNYIDREVGLSHWWKHYQDGRTVRSGVTTGGRGMILLPDRIGFSSLVGRIWPMRFADRAYDRHLCTPTACDDRSPHHLTCPERDGRKCFLPFLRKECVPIAEGSRPGPKPLAWSVEGC